MPVAAILRLAGLLLCLCAAVVQAQYGDLPDCTKRPTFSGNEIYVDNQRWCVELVIHALDIEPYAFTALEVAADGSLYAARPLAGEVMRLVDSDGDALPDAMQPFASGLSLPNGLALHEGDLYVAGGAFIWRIAADGAVETLVDDLPAGSGFWTGGIAIGADERLYVAIGAPCASCAHEEPQRGVILRMNLDGSQREVFASGLRHPADLAFFRGSLWTLDSAPLDLPGGVDELIRVSAGGWNGYPPCPAESDCRDAAQPAMTFGAGAAPSSLAAYPHATHTGTENTLLVVLSGEPSQSDIVGYKLLMLSFDETDRALGATIVAPYRYESGRQAYLPWRGEALRFEKFIHLNDLGFGIYPQQPLAVAVNAQGWIYLSLTGGKILALRPRGSLDEPDRYPPWTPMHPDFGQAQPPRSLDD